jgi:hypothetical protein
MSKTDFVKVIVTHCSQLSLSLKRQYDNFDIKMSLAGRSFMGAVILSFFLGIYCHASAVVETFNMFPEGSLLSETDGGSSVKNIVSDIPDVSFTAYNDCSRSATTPANTTRYRGNGTTSGYLKDFDTGDVLPVKLTVTAAHVAYESLGGPLPDPGTDAYNVFNGKVVFDNVARFDNIPGWWMVFPMRRCR